MQQKIRFLHAEAADRWPGVFVCDEPGCGYVGKEDPRTGLKYLDHPNPKNDKVLPPLLSSEVGK